MWCEASRYQQFSRGATETIFREVAGMPGQALILSLLTGAAIFLLIRLLRKESLAVSLVPVGIAALLLTVRLVSQYLLFCSEEQVLSQLARSFDIVGAVVVGTLLLGLPVAAAGYVIGSGVRSVAHKILPVLKDASQEPLNNIIEIAIVITLLGGVGLLTIFPVGALAAFLFSGMLLGFPAIPFAGMVTKRVAINSIHTFIFGLSAAFIFSSLLSV